MVSPVQLEWLSGLLRFFFSYCDIVVAVVLWELCTRALPAGREVCPSRAAAVDVSVDGVDGSPMLCGCPQAAFSFAQARPALSTALFTGFTQLF